MGVLTTKETPEGMQSFRTITIFGITFFLIIMILTAFVIIPKTNGIVESQHSKDIQLNLKLEERLFTNFVDSQKTILQDLAQFPSLVNAVMLSDASNPVLIDQFDNVVIGGNSGRLVLQDIAGNILIQTTHDFQGAYVEGSTWSDHLLDGSIPFYFRLLGQKKDTFTFQLSIPISYNSSIEGILSAEITVPLTQAFVTQTFSRAAFKLVQDGITVQTGSGHIKIAREDSVELLHPELTFIYITDDAVIRDREQSLRNTIFLVLLTGLGISFLLIALFGYRSLISSQKGHRAKISFGRAYAMPIIIGTIGLAASVTAYLMINNSQKADLENDLLSMSKHQVQDLREKLQGNLQVLDSMKAFFDASSFVNRDDFRTFVTPHLSNHPNIQSLEWIPNIPHSERTNHEMQTRLEGMESYAIREQNANGVLVSAGLRDHYFPVYYVEPSDSNEEIIGFDLSSTHNRLAALTKATKSSNKVATGSIFLLKGEDSQSVLQVFYPVYHQTQYHEPADSGMFNRIRGYILLALKTNALVGDTADIPKTGPKLLSMHIQDITEPENPETIFSNAVINARYSFSESINVAGRSWRIDTTASSAVKPGQWLSWLVLIGGMLLTALITAGLVHLIHRREVVESIVRQRTSELRMLSSIVANSNDSFMVTDANDPDPETGRRRIVYVNEAFTRLTGYSHADVIGKSPNFLHGEKTDKVLFQKLMETIAQGTSYRGEFLHYNKDNESYWADVNVVPLTNDSGEVTHFGAVQREITHLKTAQAEREKLIGKLMDSNEELARFAFVCSHDLQEPLRMIRSFTEKLQIHIGDDLAHDEKGKKYFGFVTDGAQRAQELITDILEYSSISSSTQKLEHVNGMMLINNLKQVLDTALQDSGGKLTHDFLPNLHGNKTQLYQLFQNLINNAIKYRRPDVPLRIHLSVTDAKEYWQFSVKDNGIGMEKRHLHKIFNVFQRLHRKNQYSGTGVGLSICKKVVEQHGGSLTVESDPGVGSIFYFTLLKPTLMEASDEPERKAS